MTDFESQRREVWIKAWCATANANDCKKPSVASFWADEALEDFDKRFPVEKEEQTKKD